MRKRSQFTFGNVIPHVLRVGLLILSMTHRQCLSPPSHSVVQTWSFFNCYPLLLLVVVTRNLLFSIIDCDTELPEMITHLEFLSSSLCSPLPQAEYRISIVFSINDNEHQVTYLLYRNCLRIPACLSSPNQGKRSTWSPSARGFHGSRKFPEEYMDGDG